MAPPKWFKEALKTSSCGSTSFFSLVKSATSCEIPWKEKCSGDSHQEETQCSSRNRTRAVRHRNRTATLYLHKVTAAETQHLWPWEEINPFILTHPSLLPVCLASPPLFQAKFQTFLLLGAPALHTIRQISVAALICVTWAVSFSYSILFCYRCWHNWSCHCHRK